MTTAVQATRRRIADAVADAYALPKAYGRGKAELAKERRRRAAHFVDQATGRGARRLPAWVKPAFVAGMFNVSPSVARELIEKAEQGDGR